MTPQGEPTKDDSDAMIDTTNMTAEERIQAALDLVFRFGSIDGDHHKTWVIDQIVRPLVADGYERLVP
jgi:hypothetical protein